MAENQRPGKWRDNQGQRGAMHALLDAPLRESDQHPLKFFLAKMDALRDQDKVRERGH